MNEKLPHEMNAFKQFKEINGGSVTLMFVVPRCDLGNALLPSFWQSKAAGTAVA